MSEAYEALDVVLSQIFSQDSSVCINAISQLDEIMKDAEKVVLLKERVDQVRAMSRHTLFSGLSLT